VPGDPPQLFTVKLRVTDNNNPPQSDEATMTVTVAEPPHAPYAVLNETYLTTENIPVTFDGSASFDLDSGVGDRITKYEWDFNHDDVPDLETTQPTAAHAYPEAGLRYVGLRVWDNGVLNNVEIDGVLHENVPLASEWTYAAVTVELNLAPTDIGLTGSTVAENLPAGTPWAP